MKIKYYNGYTFPYRVRPHISLLLAFFCNSHQLYFLTTMCNVINQIASFVFKLPPIIYCHKELMITFIIVLF